MFASCRLRLPRGLLRVSVVRELVLARVQTVVQGGRRVQVLLLVAPLPLVNFHAPRAWADREGLQAGIFRRCCRGFQLSRFLT
jgi:hypothetical protein